MTTPPDTKATEAKASDTQLTPGESAILTNSTNLPGGHGPNTDRIAELERKVDLLLMHADPHDHVELKDALGGIRAERARERARCQTKNT